MLVMEPNSRPSSPARARTVSLSPSSRLALAAAPLVLAVGLRGDDALVVLEHAEVLRIRLDREAAREEVVARVARLDAHDVADLPEVRHVVPQDHLDRHGNLLTDRRS
jgi:hypothetical protein